MKSLYMIVVSALALVGASQNGPMVSLEGSCVGEDGIANRCVSVGHLPAGKTLKDVDDWLQGDYGGTCKAHSDGVSTCVIGGAGRSCTSFKIILRNSLNRGIKKFGLPTYTCKRVL